MRTVSMKQGAPSRPPLAFQDVRVWVRLGKGRKRLVVDGAGAIVGGGGSDWRVSENRNVRVRAPRRTRARHVQRGRRTPS